MKKHVHQLLNHFAVIWFVSFILMVTLIINVASWFLLGGIIIFSAVIAGLSTIIKKVDLDG